MVALLQMCPRKVVEVLEGHIAGPGDTEIQDEYGGYQYNIGVGMRF